MSSEKEELKTVTMTMEATETPEIKTKTIEDENKACKDSKKPLNLPQTPRPNHCDQHSIDRDGIVIKMGDYERQTRDLPIGSLSIYKKGHSLSNRVRKKRSGREQCIANLKVVLQCYNMFIFILGCAVFSIGIWLLVKEFDNREISAIFGSRLLEMVTYGLIAGGVATPVLAFCGYFGTKKQDKSVLGFYGVALLLVFFTLCVGFGVTFIFKDEIKEGIKKTFEETIISSYGVHINKNSKNRLITDAWDSMQQSLQCCGAHGDVDSFYSWGIYKQQSTWHRKFKPKDLKRHVPDSCCVNTNYVFKCQGQDDNYDGPPVYGPPNIRTFKDNPDLYTDGCYDKAMEYFEKHLVIVIAVTGAVPFILLIGIVIVFYLCAKAQDMNDDDEFDYEVELIGIVIVFYLCAKAQDMNDDDEFDYEVEV